uniref:Uncharacterized protein n=1 Tax=Arundo donax TaxID=35708 RepID=A0A0A8YZV9_ARUDO
MGLVMPCERRYTRSGWSTTLAARSGSA